MYIDKLKEKYNPLKSDGQPPPGPVEQSWRVSGPIVRLSEYLKANKEHGIQVINHKGMPALRFTPGLRKTNGDDRWKIAINAETLFWEAFCDLRDFMAKGLIELPSGEPRVLPETPNDRGLDSANLPYI
jgi:hypothetical protein